ncbi:MAG: ABC transporter ATP-binding protein, partial [Desulfobacteraceae bacterium]|nr:ABC transporter ATP-binding protein [Desulfobacteraceae bacterium]
GPNGAGKTTILKLLANITQQTSGHIETNGRLSALIELGAGFHPELTGQENIYLNGTILGIKKRDLDKRFEEIVDFSELENFIDTPIKRYSSGMNVRLGFSVAACIEPEILLVDEVLAVGDSIFRQKCIDRIHELIKRGTSIIFVSHNLWLVQSVCSQAIYLKNGQIEASGDTVEVIDIYDRAVSEERAQKYMMTSEENVNDTKDIEITGIDVINLEGQNQTLQNDRPAEIRVSYTASKEIGDVNAVVRIIRSDGLTCCMMRTKADGFSLSINRGSGVLSLVLNPLQLYGGSYYIQVMLRDSSDAIKFTSASSKWFYVAGSVLSHQTMNGVYEPNRKWDFEPNIEMSKLNEYEKESTE